MTSTELTAADLKELDEWRIRNQKERYQMIDDYAKWLHDRGIAVSHQPRKKAGKTRALPTKSR